MAPHPLATNLASDDIPLLETLFEQTPTPRLLVAPGGKIVRVNSALCRMLGYTSDELEGRQIQLLSHPDDRVEMSQTMRRLWAGEAAEVRFEKRYLAKDGSVRWGDLSATTVRSAAGEPLYLSSVIADITEQREAADALRRSEDRYGELVETVRGYSYVTRADGSGDLYVSPHVRQIFGFRPEQYLNDPEFWTTTVHPEDRSRVREEVAEKIASGSDFQMEYRMVDARHQVRWVVEHAAPVPATEDRPAVVQGIVVDISDSKLVEAAQAESATKSRLLEAMAVVNSARGLDEVGRAVVARAKAMLGSDTSTIAWFDPRLGMLATLADTEHGAGLPGIRVPGQSAQGVSFHAGRPVVVTDYASWPGSITLPPSRMPASLVAVPLTVHDRVVGSLAVATRRPRVFDEDEVRLLCLLAAQAGPALELAVSLEQLRDANQQLEVASRHKSEFLATMSHELRTPLNSILGFAQMLQRAEFGELDERRGRYVGHIRSSGQHLLALINQVLDLSKVEAGAMELVPERTPLVELADRVIADLKPLAVPKGVELRLEADAELEAVVDPLRLAQVLINLGSNAIKFTDHGSVAIAIRRTPRGAELAVRDTGMGIPADQLERIFEPFTQVQGDRVRQQGGTGLGLALSRRLVQLMGGALSVESQVGRGSTFTIRLPPAVN